MVEHIPPLVDAAQMARLYPDTFHLPDLSGMVVGDVVKVCNGYERFWVTLTELTGQLPGDVCRGVVANDLVHPCGYNVGDEILFERRHIYQVE